MPRGAASPDARLQRLAELRTLPTSPEVSDELRQALKDKSNLVVAKAAAVVKEKRLRDLTPDLLESFGRFMIDPVRTDKGCDAKLAIATALHELECDDAATFVRGVRHVQMEMAYGAPKNQVDTAAALRCVCAAGLARTRYRRVLEELLPLLLDPEPHVRVAAAQEIGAAGRGEGQLLLRLKVLAGDPDPEVITECLVSLLSLVGSEALEFVTGCLSSASPLTREAAALALGSSRVPGAFELLRAWFEKSTDATLRSTLLVAIGTVRDAAAGEFLLSLVASAPPATAAEAMRALKAHASDPDVRERLAAIVECRDELLLRRAMREAFG